MSINRYDLGDTIRFTAAFTTAAGVASDPATLLFKYKKPNGTITTLTYGVDSAVVKDSTGNYHVDVVTDAVGHWFYRWAGSGSGAAADEHELVVEQTVFG